MGATYEVRVRSADGQTGLGIVANFADPIDAGGAALEYTLNAGQVGVLRLTVPAWVDPALFPLDARIGVWRSVGGRPPQLDGQAMFLVRSWRYTETATTITAYHATSLLKRRIIAYAAGSAQASKSSGFAGDIIKAYASENLGSGIVGASRDGSETQADLSTYLTIQANLADGAAVATADARQNLFTAIRDLCDASTQNGTYLTAEIVAPTEQTLELRTYAGQRGVDRRASTTQPVILSAATGSLENVVLEVDRSEEVTWVSAGGQGEQTARLIATQLDATRMAESVVNRCEQFGDYSNITDATQLQAKADALVRAGRPRITFTADIIETDGATRGVHYDFGDLLTAEARGQQYDVRLDVVQVSLREGKQHQVVQVRSVT
jgi:hypothetical protein